MAALSVFVLGILAACLDYGLAPAPVESDDPATIGNDKADAREFERQYGEIGLLEKRCLDALNQPGTQAVLIAAAGTLAAAATFGAARLLERKKHAAK